MFTLKHVNIEEAKDFLSQYYSSLLEKRWQFTIAVENDIGIVGVMAIGTPASKSFDDGQTLEVIRYAVSNNIKSKKVKKILFNAAIQSVKYMGYERLILWAFPGEPMDLYKKPAKL